MLANGFIKFQAHLKLQAFTSGLSLGMPQSRGDVGTGRLATRSHTDRRRGLSTIVMCERFD
jgi:hypothetical protein